MSDEAAPKETPQRYNSVSIIFHWMMALGFFLMLGSGFIMTYVDLDQSLKFQMYQWHKSGGVLMLIAIFLRISWRLRIRAPKLPASFDKLEQIAAKAGHMGLYVVMVAMPVSGWIMVSSSVYGLPTIVFDWFEWPHIPGIQGNEGISSLSKTAHFALAILLCLLLVAHIGAVIKHYVIDKENLLTRMWWGMDKTEKGDV